MCLIMGVVAQVMAASARSAFAADTPPVQAEYIPRETADLQQLVAPIALYPDALLAQVLAATTYPDDVIEAARWEDAGNNPQAVDAQPWDSSVKGVARYPSILHYLAGHGDWMNDLGDAFLNQQGDVMSAVQNLRGEALAAGTLVSTAQQTVINEGGYIQIIPTNPDILYAPIYNPLVVYDPPPYAGGDLYTPYITYGLGVDVGDWLDFDLDWYDRGIYFGGWGRDRPWWHDRDHGGIHHYNDTRPGIYRAGQFHDLGSRPINAQADHWTRDNRRPGPRQITRPIAGRANARPERGYARQSSVQTYRPAQSPRGTDASQSSARGKVSRQRAAPGSTRVTPGSPLARVPVRQAPVRQQSARSVPRQSAPPPEARQSAPVRGGAMGGYRNGAAASHSASRGGASRGGGGGSRGGGGGSRGRR